MPGPPCDNAPHIEVGYEHRSEKIVAILFKSLLDKTQVSICVPRRKLILAHLEPDHVLVRLGPGDVYMADPGIPFDIDSGILQKYRNINGILHSQDIVDIYKARRVHLPLESELPVHNIRRGNDMAGDIQQIDVALIQINDVSLDSVSSLKARTKHQ